MSIPEKLYRRIDHNYVDSFLKEGLVRFMPLKYYREIEANRIGDPQEGTEERVQGRDGLVQIKDPKTGEFHDLGTTSEFVLSRTVLDAGSAFIASFSMEINESQNEYGDTCLLFHDTAELLKRIEQAMPGVSHGPVAYYDRDEGPVHRHDIEICFLKSKCFSEDHEYRFAVATERHDFLGAKGHNRFTPPKEVVGGSGEMEWITSIEAVVLKLGDLSHLCEVVD